MKNNLIFLSLLLVSCSMSSVQINAAQQPQSTGGKIWELSKTVLKGGLKLTARIGWETIKFTPKFIFFPIKHLYSMGKNLGDAFEKKDFKQIICAIYEGTAVLLWLGALIFLMHGATVAAQFFAENGIVSTETAAGFEIVNNYTWMNPYFQSILGYIKTFTAYELGMLKDCMSSGLKNLPGCLGNMAMQTIKASYYTTKAMIFSGVRLICSKIGLVQ
ncbi:MAG: hypothetical protein US49_C0001G0048 [candidate division TM6 bacterium GW2011_GWF2_37_49]|nr:MAG: hypothetical protein US49_C0001G0048 [candidate division TM6 bacterium GW2011_GWF2_37_49]